MLKKSDELLKRDDFSRTTIRSKLNLMQVIWFD